MAHPHVHAHHAISRLDEHAGESWIGRLDARAKILGVFAFVIVCALMTRLEAVVASLAVAVALAAASGIPALHVSKAYLVATPFIALSAISVFLFTGVEQGLEMFMRTSACVLALVVLASGTETFELFRGLRRLRMPSVMTNLLMLTYRYILLLADQMERMRVARKARGFSGGRSLLDRYGLKVVSFTAGMVFVRSSDRADRIYEGLRSKGFRKDLVLPDERRFAAAEAVFVAALLGASAGLALVQLEVLA